MHEEMNVSGLEETIVLEPGLGMAVGLGMMMVSFLAILLLIAASWRLFTKAGKPGWAALVPIYNVVVMLEITGKPLWWVILWFIPFVNLAVSIAIIFSLARVFGKSTLFAVGLLFLGMIFFPILAFGDARYQDPALAGT